MNKRPLHPAIEHLSSTEIEALFAEYLAGTKVSALISRFNIKCTANQLYRVLPPHVLDRPCSACGSVMVQDLPSRSYPNSSPKIHCSSCSHEEGGRCRCKHCRDLRDRLAAEEKAKREARILQAVKAERDRYACSSYSVNTLPLSTAVAFLAFSRCCPIKNGLYSQLGANPVPFAPTAEYGHALLTSLRHAGLISVSEHSDADALFYKDSQLIFVPERVYWTGDINKNLQLVKEIEECALTARWPEHWYGEVEASWSNVALAECREFFDYCAEERKLRPQGNQAITHTLENLLRDFSAAQCYNLILQGAKGASDFLRRTNTNPAHAGNYMAGACQRAADRARAEGYQVKPFRRNFNLPRSMISYILFDVILKIGERGFSDPILRTAVEAD